MDYIDTIFHKVVFSGDKFQYDHSDLPGRTRTNQGLFEFYDIRHDQNMSNQQYLFYHLDSHKRIWTFSTVLIQFYQ